MTSLHNQLCANHAEREAVARCPECHRFYCRECISEHEDRVLCAQCLRRLSPAPLVKQRSIRWLIHPLQGLCGLLVLWVIFYATGRFLISLEYFKPIHFQEQEAEKP